MEFIALSADIFVERYLNTKKPTCRIIGTGLILSKRGEFQESLGHEEFHFLSVNCKI